MEFEDTTLYTSLALIFSCYILYLNILNLMVKEVEFLYSKKKKFSVHPRFYLLCLLK